MVVLLDIFQICWASAIELLIVLLQPFTKSRLDSLNKHKCCLENVVLPIILACFEQTFFAL